jgi:hypothetical protein
MAPRNYPRLDIETFGRHLLQSGDLDPIYIALNETFLAGQQNQLKRWLIAYWCCYHAGQSCYISEAIDDGFWSRMQACAMNTQLSPIGQRWQRGHERRHFRGVAAEKAIDWMAAKYPKPEDLVDDIIGSLPELLFDEVASRAQKLPLFGPWISFKVADMLDRCLGVPVHFDLANVMYKDPSEAAVKLWRVKAGVDEKAEPKDRAKAIQDVVDYLVGYFSNFRAPPLGERPVGLQEIETILCKWKSHMNGHYPLNNDILEIQTGLTPWRAASNTAKNFISNMPKTLPSLTD